MFVLGSVGCNVLNFAVFSHQWQIYLDDSVTIFIDFQNILWNVGVSTSLVKIVLNHMQKGGFLIFMMNGSHYTTSSGLETGLEESKVSMERVISKLRMYLEHFWL